jgi:putative tryptophan/tyrosine transport system substrate-binding protein
MRRREFIAGLGGAAAWPVVAPAQQATIPVIGFLLTRSTETAVQVIESFRQGLREAGFLEGQNVIIEYRFADGRFDLLPALATDLVGRRVTVIAAAYPSGRAVKAATGTTPIVFIGGSDPVQMGLVASINRPGGNVTGVSVLAADLETKRLGLLHEIVPQATSFGALIDRTNQIVFPESDRSEQELQKAARRLGVPIQFVAIEGERDFDMAFDKLVRGGVGALVIAVSAFFNVHQDQLISLSARHGIPTIYEFRQFAEAGGLMTYSPSLLDMYHQAGGYVGRIIKGEKPSDLPVLLPTKFEFVLNLKTAKALGLTIPETLLATADEVIQ